MLEPIKYLKVSFESILFSKVDTLNIDIVIKNFDGINNKFVNSEGITFYLVLNSNSNFSFCSISCGMNNFNTIWFFLWTLEIILYLIDISNLIDLIDKYYLIFS